jgi:hypothetical protein
MIILNQLSLRGWFKKENWKVHLYNVKKQNEIKLKKMAKDLEVNYSGSQKVTPTSDSGGIAEKVLPAILKNLSPDQTAAIAEKFLPEDTEEGDIGSTLMNFASQNPDVVKQFLDKLGNKNNSPPGTSYE